MCMYTYCRSVSWHSVLKRQQIKYVIISRRYDAATNCDFHSLVYIFNCYATTLSAMYLPLSLSFSEIDLMSIYVAK